MSYVYVCTQASKCFLRIGVGIGVGEGAMAPPTICPVNVHHDNKFTQIPRFH